MNPIQTQIEIENAITNRSPSADGRYHLCFFENEIRCCLKHHTRVPHEVFHVITPTEMRDGFTAQQWRTIGDKVYTYLEGFKKWQKAPPQSTNQNEPD